jgi:GR25 family glycosyltransferase involved in LPS biosynthesis
MWVRFPLPAPIRSISTGVARWSIVGATMEAYFINLDEAAERRTLLADAFHAMAPPTWHLNRVAALTPADVAARDIPGRIRPTEKACLLSHRRAIEMSLASDGPSLILEDDALLGPTLFARFDSLSPVLDNPEYDIVYTDVCIPGVHAMIDLFITYRDLIARGTLNFINLRKQVFAGATAYFVTRTAKRKLLGLLDEARVLDLPYDLLLRKWVHEGRLNALSVFPFLTSLSDHADASQIQLEHSEVANATWNAFRRIMWIDADARAEDVTRRLDRFGDDYYDAGTQRFAKILKAALSSNFRPS